jgi:hypothetical protein
MNTFIYVNGRPDHQKGHHDDLIMSLAMATYVSETSFTNLNKVTEQAKAMINAWGVANNETATKQLDFNPGLPVMSSTQVRHNQNEPTKNDYMNYGWLFGRR